MFTDINKHGATIATGAVMMGEGFVTGSKSIVEGLGVIALTYSFGLSQVAFGLGSIIYDGLATLPIVEVCR